MTKKTKKTTEPKTTMNAYVLLDRSGSMSTRWNEALKSINAYVKELAEDKGDGVESVVTVATFDGHNGLQFDLIRDAVAADKYKEISDTDATPRGMTPLFDAIGRFVAHAEKADHKRTVVLIMTDGEENNSREVTKEAAGKLIDRCKARDWQVIFMGADFNAFAQANSVGVNINQTINMTTGNYDKTMRSMAGKARLYASGASGQSVSFSAEDRDEAEGKKG